MAAHRQAEKRGKNEDVLTHLSNIKDAGIEKMFGGSPSNREVALENHEGYSSYLRKC